MQNLILPSPLFVWQIPATVQCGFPSPAEDHQRTRLDIRELLIHQADATFFMRVRGSSMRNAGIDDGDFIIVDKSITPRHGHIVLAVIDGEFTLKRLYQKNNITKLQAANPCFTDILIKSEQELSIWGVITWTLKCHYNASRL